MALDSLGNPRIDFVWGSMPVQPNSVISSPPELTRLNVSRYPGDGEAEYILDGHAPKETFEMYFGKDYSDKIKYQQGTKPATRLNGLDAAPLALKAWNGFPGNIPNLGSNNQFYYWQSGNQVAVPAFQFPDIIGMDLEDAKKALISCGVDPKILVPIEFNAPDAYKYSGYQPGYGYYNPVPAPGTTWSGVIMFRYMNPNDVVGQHWDGSTAYAHEFNNKVQYTGFGIDTLTPVDPNSAVSWQNIYSYPHSFVVIQTEDPRYNSYQWWD